MRLVIGIIFFLSTAQAQFANKIQAQSSSFDCSLQDTTFRFFDVDTLSQFITNAITIKIYNFGNQHLGFEILDRQTGLLMETYNKSIEDRNYQSDSSRTKKPSLEIKHIYQKDQFGYPLNGLKISSERGVATQVRCEVSVIRAGTTTKSIKSDGTSYGGTQLATSGSSVTTDRGAEVCKSVEMKGNITFHDVVYGQQTAKVSCRFQGEQSQEYWQF